MSDRPRTEERSTPRRYLLLVAALPVLLSVTISAQESRTVASHLEEIEATARQVIEQAAPEQAALIRADLAFSADARARHVSDAFADRYLPDGLLISRDAPPIVGPDAVREALKSSTAEWHWAPVEARVSGDLGVNWGIAALVVHADGAPEVYRSRYVTVWERDADGTWRIAIDIGNEGPGPD